MIHWPVRYDPSRAPIHVANGIDAAAPPEAVWAWLVRAPLWPSWYPNASNVILEGRRPELGAGVVFTWTTFGVAIRSRVLEFVPNARIAWSALGLGVDAYHAWEITPAPSGSRVITEETQYGWAARLGKAVFPNRMSTYHQLWLERLAENAKGGPPLP